MPPALAIGGAVAGGAILGGISGSMKDKSSYTYDSNIDAGNATNSETLGQNSELNAFSQLQEMVKSGPSQSDVTAGTSSSRDLAEMLRQYAQQGGNLPTDADISSSNSIAGKLFDPQRVALNQSFIDQNTQANRQAAMMGRSIDDPILAAKLRVGQTLQTQQLNANQGAWSQNFALQQPGQRLGFMQNRDQVLGGLASQAMKNRQSLASMGEGIMNNERNFRLQTARRYGNQESESGGGLKGAISGALGGVGTVMSLSPGFGGMGAGGGGLSSAAGNQMSSGVGNTMASYQGLSNSAPAWY